MKLRWKLLIILLAISIIPMIALSITTRTTSHELAREMTTRSRDVLISRAKHDLLRLLEDHAQIASRERQIVNLALKTQSGRLRQILEGRNKQIRKIGSKGVQNSTKHFMTEPGYPSVPVKTDLDNILISFTENSTITRPQADQLFRPMLRSFQKLERSNPDLVYWQIIRLANGTIATYPFYETKDVKKTHTMWMKSMDDPKTSHENWYEIAKRSTKNIFWTQPFRDPVTDKLVVAAVSKIKEFKGPFYGAIMVMVPLGTVLKGKPDLTGLSDDSSSLLVSPQNMESGNIGLKVIAEEHLGKKGTEAQSGWIDHAGHNWLHSNDNERLESIAQDLRDGTSGTTWMQYNGEECLWVYAPIKLSRTGLIMVVPLENILGKILEAELFVKKEIENQFLIISAIIWAMAAIILIISIILSKTMTKRISQLATAFNSLAMGDFSTRVDITGRDELSKLSRTFNQLAPALEEQIRLKEALTVAQEVQRSLLPEHPPQVKGLDVAGMSMYCEDTGGDYFDYPHLGIKADELGLAVGDVSGHGVPAALLMTTARALLRQRAQSGGNLGAVVGDANTMLAEDVRLSGRFMTLFMFAIDLKTHTARWVRAGHDPALVYLPSKNKFSELGGDTGLPLGVDGDWVYIEESSHIETGSVILIGTDGIWEATNMDGNMFGKERLNELLRIHSEASAQSILDSILQSLKDFTAEAGFDDDVTLAVVKVLEQ